MKVLETPIEYVTVLKVVRPKSDLQKMVTPLGSAPAVIVGNVTDAVFEPSPTLLAVRLAPVMLKEGGVMSVAVERGRGDQ